MGLRRILGLTEDTSNEDIYEIPEQKSETITKDVTKNFTEYKITIEYEDGSEETEYVHDYTICNNHIELYNTSARLYVASAYNGPKSPGSFYPSMTTERDDPQVISLANVKSVGIEEYDKLVYVARDVEYEQIYKQYKKGGAWQESHTEVADRSFDEYDIHVWSRQVWENDS